MRVEQTASSPGFGPFFGVSIYDDSDNPLAPLTVAALGMDASTGDLLYQEGGSGFLIEAGTSLFAEWRHFRIELDFGTDSYKGFVDGVEVASTDFVDVSFGIDQLTDVDIVGYAAGGDAVSQSLEGVAYFDNLIVRDGLRGDYNNDGLIDAADYTVWRDLDGQSGFALAADGDADGDVDAADYQIWADGYGDSNSLAPSLAIPEPTALVLAAATCLTASRLRRRSA